MTTRRAVLGLAGGLAASAFAPAGLRLGSSRRALWRREGGAKLRGAVFVQRRVYGQLDGPEFLGPGPFGQPITDAALDSLAAAGANLASWSGPGLFSETAPFSLDAAVEDHVADWLDRCRARGLYTVLCLRSGPGRSAFAFHPGESWYPPVLYDASLWANEEKQAAWAEMVAQTLRRFGDHPALAGVKALEEPNGADLGHDGVWPPFARRIKAACADQGAAAPLIFSPDRWGRAVRAAELRAAIGPEPVIAVHDYSPWVYTHQAPGDGVQFDRARHPAKIDASGDVAVMEFGVVRSAPDPEDYLAARIAAFEAAGANWAVFRWTSGWTPYERKEGAMAISAHPASLAVLRRAFAHNRARPD